MDEDQEQNGDLELAPTEEDYPLEQRVIPFMGDELAAALTQTGGIYISLPGMCGALGLNARGQLQRIQRTNELAIGLRRIPIQTKGGRQVLNCLRIDKLGLWLAGIETARVKSQFRAKLDAYHQKLAPVAIQIFLSMAGVPSTSLIPANASPELAALRCTNRTPYVSCYVSQRAYARMDGNDWPADRRGFSQIG